VKCGALVWSPDCPAIQEAVPFGEQHSQIFGEFYSCCQRVFRREAASATFVAGFIVKVLAANLKNWPTFLRLLGMIEAGTAEVIELVLIDLFSDMVDAPFPPQILTQLGRLLASLFLCSKLRLNCEAMAQALWAFCMIADRFRYFLLFWFFSFPNLSERLRNGILYLFRIRIGDFKLQKPSDYHPFLYFILANNISRDSEFASMVWTSFVAASKRQPDEERTADYFKADFEKKMQALMNEANPLPDPVFKAPSHFLTFVFSFACKAAGECCAEIEKFLARLNIEMKSNERYWGNRLSNEFRDLSQRGLVVPKTFRLSSFHAAGVCPLTFLPSPFEFRNSAEVVQVRQPRLCGAEISAGYSAVRRLPQDFVDLARYSGVFKIAQLGRLFRLIFGEDLALGGGVLWRKAIELTCVCAASQSQI
jgi:hypothetical protein